MLIKTKEITAPKGWALRLYRVPIFLYRIGLGGLLGKRFILLNHVGRKSGSIRRAVLEVVRYDPGLNEFVIASGFGERSQWYKNLMLHPQIQIQTGWDQHCVMATRIPPVKAELEMIDYGHRNPKAASMVAGLIGYTHSGSDDDLRDLSKIVPLLKLVVTSSN